MSELLALLAGLLAMTAIVAPFLWMAERSFAHRWSKQIYGIRLHSDTDRGDIPESLYKAMRWVVTNYPRIASRLAIQIEPGLGPSTGYAELTSIEKAWIPFGSWVYKVRLDAEQPAQLLLHAVIVHLASVELGKGWNREGSPTYDQSRFERQVEVQRELWPPDGWPFN